MTKRKHSIQHRTPFRQAYIVTMNDGRVMLWADCHSLDKAVKAGSLVKWRGHFHPVSGGVAEVTTCPDWVDVDIIDHDNEREG